MLFDSHAHYDDERFDEDRDILLQEMPEKGISCILNAASNLSSSRACIELAKKYSFIYAAVGVHPHDLEEMTEDSVNEIKKLAEEDKVVAIGEIGLDYYYENSPRDLQKYWFRRQLQLAKQIDLPVIIHDRDAHADCMQIVKEEDISKNGGVFHCYSGSWEMARQLLEMGLYISIAGPVTYNKNVKTVEVVKNIPLDKLLIETDSPYLTPVPHRGKRNDSTYVRYVAEKIAEIKGISLEQVASQTMDNAKRLFRIAE